MKFFIPCVLLFSGFLAGWLFVDAWQAKIKSDKAKVESSPIKITGDPPDVQFLPPVDGLVVCIIGVEGKKYVFATKDGAGAICEQ